MLEDVQFDVFDDLLEVPLKDNASQSAVSQRWADPVSVQTHSGPSPRRHGVTVGFPLREGFSSNSTPDFSDNTGLLWGISTLCGL